MSVSATSILGLLAAILNLARAVLARVSRPTARQRAAKAIHDARAASATGDATTVNAITEKARIENQLLAIISLSLLLLTGCGCSLIKHGTSLPWQGSTSQPDQPPKVVVIPADRQQYLMTNSVGTVGWFVPLAVHTEFMEALELLNYYRQKQTKGNTK